MEFKQSSQSSFKLALVRMYKLITFFVFTFDFCACIKMSASQNVLGSIPNVGCLTCRVECDLLCDVISRT